MKALRNTILVLAALVGFLVLTEPGHGLLRMLKAMLLTTDERLREARLILANDDTDILPLGGMPQRAALLATRPTPVADVAPAPPTVAAPAVAVTVVRPPASSPVAAASTPVLSETSAPPAALPRTQAPSVRFEYRRTEQAAAPVRQPAQEPVRPVAVAPPVYEPTHRYDRYQAVVASRPTDVATPQRYGDWTSYDPTRTNAPAPASSTGSYGSGYKSAYRGNYYVPPPPSSYYRQPVLSSYRSYNTSRSSASNRSDYTTGRISVSGGGIHIRFVR